MSRAKAQAQARQTVRQGASSAIPGPADGAARIATTVIASPVRDASMSVSGQPQLYQGNPYTRILPTPVLVASTAGDGSLAPGALPTTQAGGTVPSRRPR